MAQEEKYLTNTLRARFEKLDEDMVRDLLATDPDYRNPKLRAAALEWRDELRVAREKAEFDHRKTEAARRKTEDRRFWIIAVLAGVSAAGVLVSWLAASGWF